MKILKFKDCVCVSVREREREREREIFYQNYYILVYTLPSLLYSSLTPSLATTSHQRAQPTISATSHRHRNKPLFCRYQSPSRHQPPSPLTLPKSRFPLSVCFNNAIFSFFLLFINVLQFPSFGLNKGVMRKRCALKILVLSTFCFVLWF